jgi:hypothetical protein
MQNRKTLCGFEFSARLTECGVENFELSKA